MTFLVGADVSSINTDRDERCGSWLPCLLRVLSLTNSLGHELGVRGLDVRPFDRTLLLITWLEDDLLERSFLPMGTNETGAQ